MTRPADIGRASVNTQFAPRSIQKQAWLPANAFGAGAEFLEGPVLDLADALFANPEQVADLPQAVRATAGQAESQVEHLLFPRPQVLHQEPERFLPLVVRLGRAAGV